MSKYNLSTNLSSTFDFEAELNGEVLHYTAKYPSQKELRPIQKGYAELKKLDKEYGELDEKDSSTEERRKEIEAEVEKISNEIAQCFNGLFSGCEKPISEFLDEAPLNLKNAFDAMIQKEFNVNA